MIPRDPDHPHVRWERFVVRDINDPDLGVRAQRSCDLPDLKWWGVGSLLADAYNEIEDRLVLENYVGEAIAEVYVDVEDWTYAVEYLVEIPLRQRLRRIIIPLRSNGGEYW